MTHSMTNRALVETYVANRPEAPTWTNPYDTITAIVDVVIVAAPLHTWTTDTAPPTDLLTADDVARIIAQVTTPTLSWTRTDTTDYLELLIEGVAVTTRTIDTTTIDWILTNAHATARADVLTAAGLTHEDVTTITITL